MAEMEEMEEMEDFLPEEESGKKKKRGKKQDKEEKEGFFGKLLTFLIVFFILVIWLAIFALLIKYDVGEFGSTVLRPVFKDIPVIKEILPDVSDEQIAEEDQLPYRNLSEAMVRIRELESELKSIKGNRMGSADYVSDLEMEIKRLKTFEENQLQFEAEKARFDKEVVFHEKAPEIEEYKKFYEGIAPENAEEIYRQVIEQQQVEKNLKEQAEMYKNMEPVKAARILEGMTGDLDLVSKILLHMKTRESGAILAEMNPNMAAKITKKISLIQGNY